MSTSELFDQDPPFWIEEQGDRCYIADETEHWVTAVVQMGFNDRIVIVRKDHWGRGWNAGFCYDKGGGAFVHASAFNAEIQQRPSGFKKIAFDTRPCEPFLRQLVCQFCSRELEDARASKFDIDPYALDPRNLACAVCGSVEPPHPLSARKYAWFFLTAENRRLFRTPQGRLIT